MISPPTTDEILEKRSTSAADDRRTINQVIVIALCAIALRLLYQAAIAWSGGTFHNGSDSEKYLIVARALFLDGIAPETDRLPLYNYLLAAVFKIVGGESLRAVVTVQAFLDGASVLGLALAARAFGRELIIPVALTAAVIPNFIVHSSYILQENVFTFFLVWGWCAVLWAVAGRSTAKLLVTAGVLFGFTLLTRLSLSYFWIVLLPVLAFALRSRLHLGWLRCIGLSLLVPAAMLVVVSPLLIYHRVYFGYAALSSQTGDHLLNWFSACLTTPWPCADRGGAVASTRPLVQAFIQGTSGEQANPFAISAFQTKLAIERMMGLPLWQIAWGMIWGAFRNTFQTGFYQVFTQFNQPPTFLSAMPGGSAVEKLRQFFVVNMTNPFMILWAISQTTLLLSRLVQAFGAFSGLKDARIRGMTLLLLLSIAYTLTLNGPFADPKYRIPMEPALIILFGLGVARSRLIQATLARLRGRAAVQP